MITYDRRHIENLKETTFQSQIKNPLIPRYIESKLWFIAFIIIILWIILYL